MTFAPWQPLKARPDDACLGGIAVEGEGAPLVRDALAALYGRIRDLEEERDHLRDRLPSPGVAAPPPDELLQARRVAHQLDPTLRIHVDEDLGPELEAFNAADPHCERCGGLGVIEVAVVDKSRAFDVVPAVKLERGPCPCVSEAR